MRPNKLDAGGVCHKVNSIELTANKNILLRISISPEEREAEKERKENLRDAIHFHVRSEGQIVKKAVYVAIGINMDGI